MQTVSIHDSLHFGPAADGQIIFACDAPEIPTDDTNLIVRAAYELQAQRGISRGASIWLEKRIPVKAGLGGASSNAAITLLGLARLWTVDVPVSELVEIGARLGADVPFFFFGGCALATGTGTRVTPLRAAKQYKLIIVTPDIGVSTSEAYAALDSATLTTNSGDSILSISHGAANFGGFEQERARECLQNDFERVIFDIEPEIERAKGVLVQAGAVGVLLAGSGSSVFGMFENQDAQQRAYQEVQREPKWRVFPCATLSREDYLIALGWRGI